MVMNTTGLGTLGRVGIVPVNEAKLVASVDLAIVELDERVLIPDYAALFLNSGAGFWQSQRLQTGSSGQLHLYPDHIRKILVYVRRDAKGKVDLDFQKCLAAQIAGSMKTYRAAIADLRKLYTDFQDKVGISMSLAKE